MVKELWNDPVGSAVIAALITAAILAVVTAITRLVSPGTLTRLVSRWQGEIRGVFIATAIYAAIWVAVAVLRGNPARVPEATTSTPQIEATSTPEPGHTQPIAGLPLHDNAVKWRLSEHLRNDFAAIPSAGINCKMVIVHYDTSYSEYFTHSLSNVLAGICEVRDFYAETMIPEGITLKFSSDMPDYEPTKSYLLRIKERLRSDAGIIAADDPNLNPVFHIPPQHPITQGPQDQYGEIVIGNEPGT